MFGQRRAKLFAARATVFGQEHNEVTKRVDIGAVDNGPAPPNRRGKACPSENGKMRRHGIGGYAELPSDLAGRQAIRLVANEKTKDLKAGDLSQGAQCICGV